MDFANLTLEAAADSTDIDAAWVNYFGTSAQVSVTAFALMFTAMQIRHSAWRVSRVRTMAGISALAELFVPVVVGMIVLMETHPWQVAARVGGGLGLSVILVHFILYRKEQPREGTHEDFDRLQMKWGLLSVLVYALIASSPWWGDPGLYVLAGASLWLLFSGSFESWWVLDPGGLSDADESNELTTSPPSTPTAQ